MGKRAQSLKTLRFAPDRKSTRPVWIIDWLKIQGASAEQGLLPDRRHRSVSFLSEASVPWNTDLYCWKVPSSCDPSHSSVQAAQFQTISDKEAMPEWAVEFFQVVSRFSGRVLPLEYLLGHRVRVRQIAIKARFFYWVQLRKKPSPRASQTLTTIDSGSAFLVPCLFSGPVFTGCR